MSSGNEGFTSGPSPRVAPADVQNKEFRVSRFGGYKMRDVDEFLDEVTVSLSSLVAENDRLRSQVSAPPVVGSPDLDDVSRQADEIIQRARDEAAQILADARAGAVTAAAIGGGESAGPVNAFLVQEREFLQGLAALVQGHADSVKGMAKAARGAASEAGSGTAAVSEARPAEPSGDTAATGPSGEPDPARAKAEATQDEPAVGEAPVDESDDADEPTVHIDDPQPAAARAGDGEADGSLRELFWGEED